MSSKFHLELTFCCGVLVLLIFAHQIVHVRFGLREFLDKRKHATLTLSLSPRLATHHLVHAFACVPMQESFATEHRRELLRDTLEQLLDRRAVT